MTLKEATVEAKRRWGDAGKAYMRVGRTSAPCGVGVFGTTVRDDRNKICQPVGWGPTFEEAFEAARILKATPDKGKRERVLLYEKQRKIAAKKRDLEAKVKHRVERD